MSNDHSLVVRPDWLENPELDGFVAIVASAMPQSMGRLEGQRRAAMLRARADLAKDVRVFVSKSLSIQKQNNLQRATASQRIDVRTTELQQLVGAKIRAEWVDPKNHELFIWYVIPTNE